MTSLLAFLFMLTTVYAAPLQVDVTTTPISCPSGSFAGYANPFCYKVFHDPLYFMDAELACNQLNGHLASIHSAYDNVLITGNARSLVGPNATVFTGANNLADPSSYVWIDGKPFDFTDFGYPIDQDPNKNCLKLNTTNGRWYSEDCYTPSPYLCELSPVTN